MSKSNNTMLYIGGAAVLGYMLLNKSGNASTVLPGSPGSALPPASGGNTAVATSVSNVVQQYGTYLLVNSPAPPGNWPGNGWQNSSPVKTWYLTYELPAHKLVNPNVANSAYTLTDAECAVYLNNYAAVLTSLQTAAQSDKNDPTRYHGGGTINDGARWHWHTYGVATQRTFLPMYPPDNESFNPIIPPANNTAPGSGGSWVSTALEVAGSIVALLGPNDVQLTNADVAALATAAPVLKDILPYYYKSDRKLAMAIEARLDGLLAQYLK